MRVYRLLLLTFVAALALNASVAFSQDNPVETAVPENAISEVIGTEYVYNPYGSAGFGYTAYGYRPIAHPIAAAVGHTVVGAGRLAYHVVSGGSYIPYAPYAPSYYQYSPVVYGTDPDAQWTYRGFHHFPVWEYTPQLIPPKPHHGYHCCHNSGLCTPECPCCPLCNINGCCDEERAIEAGDDYRVNSNQSPSLAPVPEKAAKASNGSTDVPAKTSDDVEESTNDSDNDSQMNSLLDSVNSSKVKTSQVSWSKPNPDGTPSNRLSNIDVRSSRGVIFTIWAPNQAKVYVNGAPTTSIGSKRTFASVNLRPGLKYQYVIDAVVEKDGKTYSESKTIIVSAGDVKTVAFAFPELNTIPSDEWSGEGF